MSTARTPWRFAALASAATLFAGFGVMLTLWSTYGHRYSGLGWTHYRAATFGDGLLLPTLIAGLVVSHFALRPYSRTSPKLAAICASVAAIGGAALQASWLLDDHPQTNWSLPRSHHFAFSGWYHATFLVLMSSIFAALTADVAYRTYGASRQYPSWVKTRILETSILPILLIPAWTFSGLVTYDGGHGSSEWTTIGSVLSIVVISTSVLLWCCWPVVRCLPIRLSLCAGASVSLTLLMERREHLTPPGIAISAGVVLLALSAGQLARDWAVAMRVNYLVTVVPIASALVLLPMDAPARIVGNLVLALTIFPVAVMAAWDYGEVKAQVMLRGEYPWLASLALPASTYFYVRGAGRELTGSFTLLATGIIFGRLFFRTIKLEFERFIVDEETRGPTPDADRSRLGLLMSIRLGCLAMAALLAFGTLAAATAPSLGFATGRGAPHLGRQVIVILITIVLGSIVTALQRIAPSARIARVYTCAWVGLMFGVVVYLIDVAPHSMSWLLLFVLSETLLVAIWQFEGAFGNALMHGYRFSSLTLAVMLGESATIATAYYWGVFAAIRTRVPYNLFASLWPFGLAFGLAMLVSLCAAMLLRRDGPELQTYGHYGLTANYLQDTGLMGLLCFAALWVPSQFANHVEAHTQEHLARLAILSTSYMVFFAPALIFALNNNCHNAQRFAEWAGRSPSRRAWRGLLPMQLRSAIRNFGCGMAPRWNAEPVEPSPQEFSEVLDAHLAFQNFLGLAVAMITLAGLLSVANEYHGSFEDPMDLLT